MPSRFLALRLSLTTALLLTAACGARPPAEPPASNSAEVAKEAEPHAEPVPEGGSCLTPADCAEGMVCEGEGCGDDTPGTCQPLTRLCTRDLRPYCGCDGETFQSSGSCPGKRFERRGPCETPKAADAPDEE